MSIDPRLLAAMQRRSGAVQFSPMQRLQAQQQQQRAQANRPRPQSAEDWAARLRGAAEQSGMVKPKGRSGLKGTLGTVFGNRAVQTALKPLTALSVPSRVIQSGWKETFDALGMGSNADGVSMRDFIDQIKDPTFGTGNIISDTGNKWLDRGIGFAGDVATDPLTYVTFGAGRLAGTMGRATAGYQLAAKGASKADTVKATRLGVTNLDDALRSQLNLGKHGLRFGGQRGPVIPGTEGLARHVGGAMSSARARIGDTKAAQAVTSRIGSEQILDQLRIAQGRAPGNPRVAAARIAAHDHHRMLQGTFGNTFVAGAKQWDSLTPEQRVALTHAVEAPVAGMLPADSAAARGREFYDDLFDALQKYGATGVEKRANYVLHALSREGAAWRAGSKDGAKFIKVDDTETTGRALARKLEPNGKYTVDGVEVRLGDATIKDVNEKFFPVLGFNLLEDDFAKLARLALDSSSRDAAAAGTTNYVVKTFPDIAADLKTAPMRSVKNEKATVKAAEKQAKNFQKQVDGTDRDIKNLWAGIKSDSKAAKAAAKSSLDDIVKELGTVSDASKRAISEAIATEANTPGALSKLDAVLKRTLRTTDRKLARERARLAASEQVAEAKGAKAGKAWDDVAARQAKAGQDRRVARKRLQARIERLESDRAVVARMIDDRSSSTMRTWDEALAGGRNDLASESGPVPRVDDSGAVNAQGVADRASDRVGVNQGKLAEAGVEQQQAVTKVLDDMGVARQKGADATADRVVAEQALKDAEDMIAATLADLARVGGADVGKKKVLTDNIEEIRKVIAQYDPTDPVTRNVLDQLVSIQKRLVEVENLGWTQSNQRAWLKAAKDGKVQPVMMDVLADGWNQVGKELFAADDAKFMVSELREQFQRMSEFVQDPAWIKYLDEYTGFFKAYATMTPGFHIRNGMSASFMNFSDGIGPVTQVQAMGMYKKLRANPNKFLADATPAQKEMVQAMFGSGSGGRWSTAELGDATRFGKWSNNIATQTSKKMGEWVEGPVRLAIAMDTIQAGGSVEEALARITRLQFDYSQLSSADRSMKRLIPFWTFMSRNLPLQLQQMWLKPRSYAHYNAFKKNFDADNDDPDAVIPQWWRDQGAFNTGLKSLGGNPLYAAPDLPFTRLQDEVDNLTDPKGFLASANPLMRVPAELMFDEKLFSGNSFNSNESKLLYALTNLAPGAAQVDRLSGGALSGAFGDDTSSRKDRQAQSIASYFGMPLRELTPLQMEQALRRLAREGGGR